MRPGTSAMGDGPGGSSGAGHSPVRERSWKDKDVKEPRLVKDDKKLKKEEFKEHKRSLSRDHSHKRSQSRDERKLASEFELNGGEPPGGIDVRTIICAVFTHKYCFSRCSI